MAWIEARGDGCRIRIRVAPRAAQTAIQGRHGDALKIRLQAPPVDGKANRALLAFLAAALAVPARQVVLLAGESGRDKVVGVGGLAPAEAARRLGIPEG
jgi:uncharacterized protein (TIGR00251 family)